MNDAILSLIITGGFAFAGLFLKYCYASKCDVIQCGCIKIHRAVTNEAVTMPENNNNNNDFVSVNIRPPVTPKKNIEEQKNIRL